MASKNKATDVVVADQDQENVELAVLEAAAEMVVAEATEPKVRKPAVRIIPAKLPPTTFTAKHGKAKFSCVATRPIRFAMLHADKDGQLVRWISTRDTRFTEASCAAYYAKRDGLPVEGYKFVEATGVELVPEPVEAEA